ANGQMLQLAETDLWFRTYRVSSMARFTYGLSLNHPMPSLPSPREVDAWIAAAQPDPLNPKHYSAPCPSVAELPDARPQSWIRHRSNVLSGMLRQEAFRSKVLNNSRTIAIYTPATSYSNIT